MTSSLPTIHPKTPILLPLEPLTPQSFSPFGTAILPSLPQTLTKVPSTLPSSNHPTNQPNPIYANQNTALKTSPISPLINNYNDASSKGTGLMSIFSCFPRSSIEYRQGDDGSGGSGGKGKGKGKPTIPIGILERHPYTTQTFCPFNFSHPHPTTTSTTTTTSSPSTKSNSKTYFLIIVAPTLQSSSAISNPTNPPDLSQIRAFYAPVTIDNGTGMAITYAPGTWHAPMMVLGSRRVDFLVTQHVNGVAEDDCQEVLIGDDNDNNKGSQKSLVVEVDLSTLDIESDVNEHDTIKAKL